MVHMGLQRVSKDHGRACWEKSVSRAGHRLNQLLSTVRRVVWSEYGPAIPTERVATFQALESQLSSQSPALGLCRVKKEQCRP